MARGELSPGKVYIGIDNGVSGSIGIVNHNATRCEFYHTPTRSCLNYQKEAKNITRVDVVALEELLAKEPNAIVLLERPLVNPGMFSATASALRAFEATLIVLERLDLPFLYLDSKEWQKAMLPNGVKGEALKSASKEVASRLFPTLRHKFKADADGLLMAEWGRRTNK